MPIFIISADLHELHTEKNGKTLHLLKMGSKQASGVKTRKQVPLMGSFAQYKESKKKPDPKQVAQQIVDAVLKPPQQPHSGRSRERQPVAVQSQITDTVMLAPFPNLPAQQKDDLKKKK